MPLLASYTSRESFFHRLHPRTKLVWLGGALTLCFALDLVRVDLVLIFIVLGSSWAAKLDLERFWSVTKVFLLLAVGMVLIQTVFHGEGEVFFRLGPLDLHREGLSLAVRGTLRLFCTLLLLLQFTMWTHPVDLAQLLAKAGLPYRYAMLMALALRFFPLLEEELEGIFEAQGARGMEFRGPLRKALALGPTAVPLCLRTLRRANEVALAMELRGYGFRSHRTYLRPITFRPVDHVMTAALVIIYAISLVAHYYSAKMNLIR